MRIGSQAGAVVAVALLVVAPAVAKKEKPPPPPLPMPVSEDGTRYEYTDVVEVEGADADELYSRAKAWVANAYHSAQDVIQLDDKDSHRLIVKGVTTPSAFFGPTSVRHTLTIETKDGKYRYSLGRFITRRSSGKEDEMIPGVGFTGGTATIKSTHVTVSGILASLREAMEVEADDDW